MLRDNDEMVMAWLGLVSGTGSRHSAEKCQDGFESSENRRICFLQWLRREDCLSRPIEHVLDVDFHKGTIR